MRRQHIGVDSALDFRTEVPHGPWTVRVLIYRCAMAVSEFNRRSASLEWGRRSRVPGQSVTSLVTRGVGEAGKASILNTIFGRGPGI